MAWYEQDTENIVNTLDRLWEERHQTSVITTPLKGRVRILDAEPETPEPGRRSPRILDVKEQRAGTVRILDDTSSNDDS
jgi:hypothetical protein